MVKALKNRLESSQKDVWQVQARTLRVMLSAFGQDFGRHRPRFSGVSGPRLSSALQGRGQEMLKAFKASEAQGSQA